METTETKATPPGRGPGRIRGLLTRLFGTLHWTAPGWLLALAAQAGRAREAVLGLMTRHHRAARGLAWGLGIAALVAVPAGWWWSHRPRPLELSVSVSPPGRTAIEATPRPDPLRVRFGGSAARLERIGKPLTQGVRLEPGLPGEWKFEDDRTLVFRPSQDWGVGLRYRVLLDGALFPEHVRLQRHEVEFTSAPFEASFSRQEFYQDPTDAQVKRVVATIAFSHPVDAADLGGRVTLALAGAKGGLLGFGARSEPITLTYDKLKGEAYVQSEPIAIPAEDTEATITVAAGARAARGGTPLAAERVARDPHPRPLLLLPRRLRPPSASSPTSATSRSRCCWWSSAPAPPRPR